MKVELYVKELRKDKVIGYIVNIEGKKVMRRISTNFEFLLESSYESLLNALALSESGIITLEIDKSRIKEVLTTPLTENVYIDSNILIKQLIERFGGKMTKQDLYREYMNKVNCSDRTAQSHAREALKLGYIEEDGYYGLKIK